MRCRPRNCAVALLALLTYPAVAAGADQRPNAGFTFSPEDPPAGQQVRFQSSSCDPDGRLVREAWDFDGDGAYDDALGRVATQVFPNAGARTVGLEVTAANGATHRKRRTVMVDTVYSLPRPDSDRLMSPYPVVRLAGRLTPNGARVRVLSVLRAPLCARVRVSCRGKSCPTKRASKYVGRRPLRFSRFERRLSAGTVLTVRVSKDDLIGKLTQFRIREGMAPSRRDRCLRPGERTGSACPRD
jgi:PKD repeat protein